MSLKIVSGGTTGAADGTLVDPSHKFTFSNIDAEVDLHIRCDDDTWSADQAISAPADGGFQISFNGGSTWKAFADNPIPVVTGIGGAGLDVGDLNFPIKVRQHATTATTSGQFISDGTFSACTALADVGSFTVTPGDGQNALSWGAVTNRTSYQVDRATDSGFTTGVTLGIYTGTGTSYTDTGRTNGTTYYYRIKAIGTYRYKDSASWATGNGVPFSNLYRDDLFTDTTGTVLSSHTPDGTHPGGAWTQKYPGGYAAWELSVKSNRVLATRTDTVGSLTVEYWLSGSSNADCAAEADAYLYSKAAGSNAVMVACRVSGASFAARNQYRAVLADDGTLTLGKMVAGTYTSLSSVAYGTLTVGQTYTVRVEAIGTAVKVYVNGVQQISVTDSSVTAGGGLAIFCASTAADVAANAGSSFAVDAVRLYNQ